MDAKECSKIEGQARKNVEETLRAHKTAEDALDAARHDLAEAQRKRWNLNLDFGTIVLVVLFMVVGGFLLGLAIEVFMWVGNIFSGDYVYGHWETTLAIIGLVLAIGALMREYLVLQAIDDAKKRISEREEDLTLAARRFDDARALNERVNNVTLRLREATDEDAWNTAARQLRLLEAELNSGR